MPSGQFTGEVNALSGRRALNRIRARVASEVIEVRRDNVLSLVQTDGEVFVMTGAVPSTTWLDGCVLLDAKGFIKTGFDLSADELSAAKWPLTWRPYLLESSLPGVFAAGDVRGGNVKRVALAVGEGSIAIPLVHQLLRE